MARGRTSNDQDDPRDFRFTVADVATNPAPKSRMRRLQRLAMITATIAIPFAAVPATSSAQDAQAVQIGTFERPVHVAVAPGKKRLLFVVEQAGRIIVLHDETALSKPFLDIRDIVKGPPDTGAGNEQGLLSVAFSPKYAKNGLFYVAFTNSKGDLEVDEFKRSARNGKRAARHSRRKLLTVRHRKAQNHNGGQLAFGPKSLLYISTGDGGGGGDPWDNARDLDSLLGKMLRINPKPGKSRNYRIPKSNPFVGQNGRNEIYSYGLRNAWRFSFDGKRILIADVGQSTQEEVNILSVDRASGANFGWPQYEGKRVFDNARPGPDPVTFPRFVYGHKNGGCSITGGFVIDDPDLPNLKGRYIYGDLCTGDVRSFVANRKAGGDRTTGLTLAGLSSFGKGYGGQIYMAQIGGEVLRLEPVAADVGAR